MTDRSLTWAETVAVFERRGLPESSYGNLYDESYDVRPGPLAIPGPLDLDAKGWTSATGVVVDGDLTVDGALLNVDDGCPALIVLGDLKAADVYLEGDVKLLVLGDVTVTGAFIGNMTEKLVMVHGDLSAAVTVLSDEFAPDLIGGTLHGPVLAPAYLGYDQDTDPAAVLVPEVLRADGADGDGQDGDDEDGDDGGLRCFDAPRVHGGRLLRRVVEGLPVALR
ncbi:hypothetical protein [Streptomyces mangrovisoli]|uniref:Uncharacterized protein n=1 Tax=Streptomyces mangrovisoli TaxID=1428628 RepID=A0A1J4P1A9_9ACTN|nr:hypothetical protein [Streptomyces mangrovisoli]OIJ68527.1 hypothetical protein WN71_006940 [Streptomyces mangrovisoli]